MLFLRTCSRRRLYFFGGRPASLADTEYPGHAAEPVAELRSTRLSFAELLRTVAKWTIVARSSRKRSRQTRPG
jgi:hypothetical protein